MRRQDAPGAGNVLLEQDGTETGVESTDTLVLEHLGETTNETAGVGRLRDETDAGCLKRAKSDISEKFGRGGRGEVDSSAVLGSRLVSEKIDPLLLEELVTTELQSTLEEVASKGWAGSGQESTGTLRLDDLAEAAKQTSVVGLGVELDASFDTVLGTLYQQTAWTGHVV